MPTRHSLLFLVAAVSPIVVAQSSISSSLSSSLVTVPTSISISLTTIRTTVTVTSTSLLPPTTVTDPASTTTFFVSPLPPETSTTTILLPSSSSSSNDLSNVPNTPVPSGTLVPPPASSGSDVLIRNPGALAGLIVGLCAVVTGLLALAWFTIKRHRQRDLENQTFDPPPTGSVRHSMSAGDIPPGNVRSRIIDDDPDLEIQSSVGHDVRSSSIGHGAIVSTLFPVELVESPGEISEQRIDHENGYYTVAASSNGHSSHGHNTIKTRNSSLTQVNVTSRNTSPTLSRQNPNRARFSLSPDRTSIPNAWYTSRSEAPSRRRSVDDASIVSYNPHRVNSEPVVLGDAPQLMSIYPRRQSSEIPRSDVFPRPGPPILVHAPPLNPPSSLLRPPSATQIPTLQTLQRSQPSTVYLDLPFVNEPFPSPTASNVSVLSGREGLLGTPPHHPTESLSSLRDEYDYSRRISVGVVSGLRDNTSMVRADSDSDAHPNRDAARQAQR